jgi:amidase
LIGVSGLRIGLDPHWNSDDVEMQTRAAIAAAVQIFSDLGATIVEIEFPNVVQIVNDWVTNCAVEAAVAHEFDYRARKEMYGLVLSQVIDVGSAVLGLDYQKILLRRAAFRGRVDALFSSVDLVLTPVHPLAPLSLATIATLGEQPELIAALQRYTCPFNMSGHPTLTLPAGLAQNGLPIGLQLIAANFSEQTLLRAGIAFQAATSWHRQRPALLNLIAKSSIKRNVE